MKITIDLKDSYVRGIKEYLMAIEDIPRPNKEDIRTELTNRLFGLLHAPQEAISDYVNRYEGISPSLD